MKLAKQILHMYVLQWRAIAKNFSAIIIVASLAFLPSLYAWFNIAANEDPYQNVSALKVAVVNLDKGTKIDVKSINVGEKIVETLKANDKIGWTFVDTKEEAINGVKDGRYYASIIISEGFSKDITSILHGTIKKPELEYYVNEKINAIAPKVTNQGVSALENEVNRAFIKTASEAILTGLQFLDAHYGEYKPNLQRLSDRLHETSSELDYFWKNLDNFQRHVKNLNAVLEDSKTNLPKVSESLNNASAMTLKAQDALQNAKESAYQMRKALAREIYSVSILADSAKSSVEEVLRLKKEGASALNERLTFPRERLIHLANMTRRLDTTITNLNASLPRPLHGLSRLSDRLGQVSLEAENTLSSLDRLSNALEKGSETTAFENNLLNSLSRLETQSKALADYFDTEGSSALDGFIDSSLSSLDGTYLVLQKSSNLIPKINDLLVRSQNTVALNVETLDYLKHQIEQSKKRLNAIDQTLNTLKNDSKLEELLKLIRKDVSKESEFLSNPVSVKSTRLFAIPNYGSAMAPFYTVLAIWVGSMLVMSMISPINKKGLERYPHASAVSMYLSRLFFYQTIAIAQAVIMTLGNLFLVDIYALHPIAMLFYNMWIAYVFSTLVFSLVFTFRSPGKAISIILLVLQVAASGGTFPVEMMPPFFQFIHPALPFTYAIIGLRELTAGIEVDTFIHAILMLVTIPVFSVLMVLIFGPRMVRLMERMEKNMKKSGLE